MPSLPGQVKAALDAFNNAIAATNYSALGPYLSPNVIIYRVDDMDPIQGPNAVIISSLNTTQGATGKWPRLDYQAPLVPNPAIILPANPTFVPPHPAPRNARAIVGQGYYTDELGSPAYAVAYSYHFDAHDLIDVAYVVPL